MHWMLISCSAGQHTIVHGQDLFIFVYKRDILFSRWQAFFHTSDQFCKIQCSIKWSDSNLVAKVWKGAFFCSSMTVPLCTRRGTESGVEPWLVHTKPRPGPHWTPLGWFKMQTASQGSSANISTCLYCVWIGTNPHGHVPT